jgi:hypothetical protein
LEVVLMYRLSVFAGSVLVLALMLVGTGRSGDTKKGTQPKAKPSLPKYWSKLKLAPTQKKEVYKVRAEYGVKIQTLKEQIQALKDQLAKVEKEERAELYKILTVEQREQLRKIIADKVGGGLDTPPEKKPKEDKK